MLTTKDLRHKFLEYFSSKGHTEVQSSSLVPRDDPSLLFTNAGMVQFKKIFVGQEKREYSRAVTSQKCLRVGGKHNDLDNVGRTARHHTFFEMLGNFSFGDYFKAEAIGFAWEFITKDLAIPKEKLYVTIYLDDDEAYDLWIKVTGIDPSRIFRLGDKDNFWSMGDTGPCGPCSEIHVDQGADMACGPNCGIGTCDCDRFLEIWNLVFMQFDQSADGKRTPLPKPSIDTGMGLERIAAVCQGVRSNFDTDLFQQFIGYAASLAGVKYGENADNDVALRVISDHSRAIAFMLADGILPSNEGRGYVLRRLIRRAFTFGRLMGMPGIFLHQTAKKVVDVMGEDYPELVERQDFMLRVIREEEERFLKTLDKGLAMLEQEMASLPAAGTISGELAFKLYDTFGFPLDIVNDVSGKQGFKVDEAGFNVFMKEQKVRARAKWKGSGEQDLGAVFASLLEDGITCEFYGYNQLQGSGRLVALLDSQALPVESLQAGEQGFAITDRTPFYGASGGQVGDRGSVVGPAGEAKVTDTLKPAPNLHVLCLQVTQGQIFADQEVEQIVSEGVRQATARNHTATHLLHAALRQVLGEHVQQAGSLVDSTHLRFDFSHIAAITPKELQQITEVVNTAILADYPVDTAHMSLTEAKSAGAMALFNEKYADEVRVIKIGQDDYCYSQELCGGTHLQSTGQTGSFLITSEAGIAAGTRRIEAITGLNSLALSLDNQSQLLEIANLLRAQPQNLLAKIKGLVDENKALRKDLEKTSLQAATQRVSDVSEQVQDVNGVKLLTLALPPTSLKALRETMDDVRSKLSSGVAALIAADPEDVTAKVNLLLYVSKDLHAKFKAGDLIKQITSPIAGSGGGRPDLAQAGGTKPEKMQECLDLLQQIL